MLKRNVKLATDLLLLVHLNALPSEHTHTHTHARTNEFDTLSVEMKKKSGCMSNYNCSYSQCY
jgi:hypothetical protein